MLRERKLMRLESAIRPRFVPDSFTRFNSADSNVALWYKMAGEAIIILKEKGMKTDLLTDILRRGEAWPREGQEEFAGIALEFGAGLLGGYRPTGQKLAGINRGLEASPRGRKW